MKRSYEDMLTGRVDAMHTTNLDRKRKAEDILEEEDHCKIAKATDAQMARASMCGICLDPSPGNRMRMHPCNHHFHSICILTWLSRANTCPICRGALHKYTAYLG